MNAPSTSHTTFEYTDLLAATSGQALTPCTLAQEATLSLSTDTRTIGAGQFFIPLSGASFDGHRFLQQAFDQGAEGAFIALSQWSQHPEWASWPNLIGVEDPLHAYMAMARFHRRRGNPHLKVVALTGSSGKTTTKEMLYAAFSTIKKTQKTEKNFNNEVGVSQTLLALQPDTEILIVEMGMRGLNQIDILSLCAEPDVALINNIGPAHIELLGSLENTAQAKLEIVQGLNPETGVLITNGDDPLLEKRTPEFWKSGHGAQWQVFSLQEASHIQAADTGGMRFNYQGQMVEIPLPGMHNVSNALAALKTGEVLGLPLSDMIRGLATVQTEGGRWNQSAIPGYRNAWIINDAYNANPDSCKASLQAFFDMKSPDGNTLKRVVILGGMKELGPFSESYHRELGDWLADNITGGQARLSYLITLGDEAAVTAETLQSRLQAANNPTPVSHVPDIEALTSFLANGQIPIENSLLLLKGSRAYHLEQVPERLTALASSSASTLKEKPSHV